MIFISVISYDRDNDGLVGDVHRAALVPVDDVPVRVELPAVLRYKCVGLLAGDK